MERNAIIEFGKNDITVRGVMESKSVSGSLNWSGDILIPSPIIKLDINRDFISRMHDYTPDLKNPYTIDIPYFPELNNSIKRTNIDYVRNLNGKAQVRNGYLLIGMNLNSDRYIIKNNYWYADTIRDLDYNNPLYRWPNPLDRLETDIKDIKDTNLYESLFLFLFGDNLDFQNKNKLIYNETNNLSRVIPIIDTKGLYPLDFLVSEYGSSLKMETIKIASTKNVRDSKPLSNPLNFNITYFGKLDLVRNKFIDEIILMNPISKNNGISKVRTSLYMYNTKDDDSYIINKITNSSDYYNINDLEFSVSEKGGKILYGLNYPEELNILNHNVIPNIDDEYVIVKSKINNIIKEKKFKVNKLMEVSQVDLSIKDSPISIGENVRLGEFKV